ncbi:hypothetical protein KY361_04410 [Candidatus Woesearchaeota archaeon]|nr:hypothetical protein [Candidatus Woesearchaeota archaeon]
MAVEIKKKVEKELESLQENFIIAVISSSESYSALNTAIVDYMVNKKKMPGVYVTMNKPYETVINNLKKCGIDTKKIFFVDAISNVIGNKKLISENCIILDSPSALTELGIVISKAFGSKKIKFLLMDSLSTMLVYNKVDTTVKFIHYLITQLRKYKLSGIILSLEKDMESKTIDSITQFCDKVIKI